MGNKFLNFYKENKTLINYSLIFSLSSIITTYFMISNSYIVILSIPLTLISLTSIYYCIKHYKDYTQEINIKKERERKQKIINEETKIFQNLSFENKKTYLLKNPESLIYSNVKKYLKIKEREKKQKIINEETKIFQNLSFENKKTYLLKNPKTLIYLKVKNYFEISEKVEKLKKIIEIENELNKKFDDQFYSEINILNFKEKLNLVLNCIEKHSNREIYRGEKVLEEKINFLTFFKVFNDDLCNIKYKFQKPGLFLSKNQIKFDPNFSINNNFILKLNEILKITENSLFVFFDEEVYKSSIRINRTTKIIYMKDLIVNHLINNYEKILGKNKVINNLNHLYKKYKYFTSFGGHIDFSYIISKKFKITKQEKDWSYYFHNKEKSSEINKLNPNYTLKGEDVLNEINSILEK